MVTSTTSFWWWLIALWQFVTKKWEYIWIGDFVHKGRFLLFWSFRLYLGASSCIYIFLAHDVFCFIWVVYDRGGYYDVFISVSYFTLCYFDYWFIFMRLFMIYVLLFMIMWNQEFILFYLYFSHMRLCVC